MNDTIGKLELIAALRLRYDHASAETMFAAALAKAGLADKASYEAREVAAWRDVLNRLGDRLGHVLDRIDALLSAQPAAVAKAPAPEPAVVAKAPAPAPAEPAVVAKAPAPAPVEPAVVAKAPAAPAAETKIELAGLELGDGERAFVCGSFVDWEVERAVELTRAGAVLRATLPLGHDPTIVFKFLRRGADGSITWEGGDDRKLVAARIEATWEAAEAGN